MTYVLVLWYNVFMKLSYLKKVRSSNSHGLNKWEYGNYLRGKHWKRFRKRMKKEKVYECWICQSKQYLQLHHKTYKNIGNEKPNQVIWLCGHCHTELHRTLNRNTSKKINLWNIAGKMKRHGKKKNSK